MIINEGLLAWMCELSYLNPEDLDGTTFDAFDNVQAFQNSGTEAVVASAGRTAVVVVRGTEKRWLDILRDIQFLFPQKEYFGRVHRGFRRSANKLKENQLLEFLQAGGFESVWFCGHSLGGAVATLLARDAADFGLRAKINLFTIGQPRVGDANWSSHTYGMLKGMGGQIERFVHPNDPVTRLPPAGRNVLPDYRHVGFPKIILGPTQVIDGDSQIESILATLFSVIANPLRIFKAHSSRSYAANLAMWCSHCKRNGINTIIHERTEKA